MPMLAEVKTSRPPIENGALSASWIRHAMALACASSFSAVQADGELVAAEPRQRVALPQAGLEPPRRRDQQLVADQVAEAVVDDLEAVEIEVQHGERAGERRGGVHSSSRRPSPSTNTARLHRPVSESRKPTLRSRSCAIACSVVSVSDPAMRSGLRAGAPAPRGRGTGTGGRCRPRGGCGARAGTPASAPGEMRLERRLEDRRCRRGGRGRAIPRAADRGVRRQADHRAPAPRDVELLRLQVPLPQAVVGPFRGQRQPLAAALQLVLRVRALGDVVPQQRHAARDRQDLDLQDARIRAGARQPDLRQRPRPCRPRASP